MTLVLFYHFKSTVYTVNSHTYSFLTKSYHTSPIYELAEMILNYKALAHSCIYLASFTYMIKESIVPTFTTPYLLKADKYRDEEADIWHPLVVEVLYSLYQLYGRWGWGNKYIHIFIHYSNSRYSFHMSFICYSWVTDCKENIHNWVLVFTYCIPEDLE